MRCSGWPARWLAGATCGLAAALAACPGRDPPAEAPGPEDPCLIVPPLADPPAPDTVVVLLPRDAARAGLATSPLVLLHQGLRDPGPDCAGRQPPGGTPPVGITTFVSDDRVDLAPPGGSGPTLRFVRLDRGADPRDPLNGRSPRPRADLLLTREPAVLDYARRQQGFTVVALAWDVTYVLALPRAPGAHAKPPAPARDALAQDAVTVEARGAAGPFWWEGDARCVLGEPAGPPGDGHVAYRRDDPTARELAERLVALAADPAPPDWVAAALPNPGAARPRRVIPLAAPELAAALREGRHAAFVLDYPRRPPDDCAGVPPRAAGGAELPLVDTRAHLVLRPGAPPVRRLGDGAFLVLPGRRP